MSVSVRVWMQGTTHRTKTAGTFHRNISRQTSYVFPYNALLMFVEEVSAKTMKIMTKILTSFNTKMFSIRFMIHMRRCWLNTTDTIV